MAKGFRRITSIPGVGLVELDTMQSLLPFLEANVIIRAIRDGLPLPRRDADLVSKRSAVFGVAVKTTLRAIELPAAPSEPGAASLFVDGGSCPFPMSGKARALTAKELESLQTDFDDLGGTSRAVEPSQPSASLVNDQGGVKLSENVKHGAQVSTSRNRLFGAPGVLSAPFTGSVIQLK